MLPLSLLFQCLTTADVGDSAGASTAPSTLTSWWPAHPQPTFYIKPGETGPIQAQSQDGNVLDSSQRSSTTCCTSLRLRRVPSCGGPPALFQCQRWDIPQDSQWLEASHVVKVFDAMVVLFSIYTFTSDTKVPSPENLWQLLHCQLHQGGLRKHDKTQDLTGARTWREGHWISRAWHKTAWYRTRGYANIMYTWGLGETDGKNQGK